jgi:hypothetical protein
MIEGEAARHLPSDRLQITGAVGDTMHARIVLPEHYAHLLGVAVQAKRQAHNTVETVVVGGARPRADWHSLTKPEHRGFAQGEGAQRPNEERSRHDLGS